MMRQECTGRAPGFAYRNRISDWNALSPNGTRLQISYLCVVDGVEATRVGYLNFDNTDEANKEYQVADDVYKNIIVPTSFFYR